MQKPFTEAPTRPLTEGQQRQAAQWRRDKMSVQEARANSYLVRLAEARVLMGGIVAKKVRELIAAKELQSFRLTDGRTSPRVIVRASIHAWIAWRLAAAATNVSEADDTPAEG